MRSAGREFETFWDEIGGVAAERLPLADMDPLVRFLLEHYLGLRGPVGRLPGRPDIDPARLVRVLPLMHMMDVMSGPPLRFRYRLVGSRLSAQVGRDPTGTFMDEYPGGTGSTHDTLVRVATRRAVSWRRGRPLLPHLPDYKWLERIVLPLARDGRTVDMTIGLTVMV